ncbi:MAG: RrF2 family transcriptional regulator [Rhodospirillales bacterium]
MQLSHFTDYALRVLIYLGDRPDQRGTIEGIASYYGLSKEHLRKVVHHLARTGFIASRRGRGGGLTLARPAIEIGIGDVVRACEENLALAECFRDEVGAKGACVIEPRCHWKGMLAQALAAFLHTLDAYTLDDVLRHEAPIWTTVGR